MNDEAPALVGDQPFAHSDGAGAARPRLSASGGGPASRWARVAMANLSVLREAKSLLFGELAESVRQGMPFTTALELASYTVDEFQNAKLREANRAAKIRYQLRNGLLIGVPALLGLLALMSFPYLLLLVALYLFMFWICATRLADPERVSRVLARNLLDGIQKGLSLPDSMRRSGQFEETEARIAEMGHQYGRLPEALQRLAQFQVLNRKLQIMGSMMTYPFVVAAVLLLILMFCLMKILPKFKDIYDQLGAELPPLTQRFVEWSEAISSGPYSLLTLIVVLSAVIAVLRVVFNGSRFSKIFLSLVLILWLAGLMGIAGARLLSLTSASDSQIAYGVIFGIGLAAVFSLMAMPYILGLLESLILEGERALGALLRHVPVIGSARNAELEARWLAALSLAVTSGADPVDAVQTAGRVCGGDLREKSAAASALCKSGHPIGKACLQARVLSKRTNYRLALLDNSRDYVGGLQQVSADTSDRALETLERVSRVSAVLSIAVMGLVCGVFAIAMYVPLFGITRIVGFESQERAPGPQRIIDPVIPAPPNYTFSEQEAN